MLLGSSPDVSLQVVPFHNELNADVELRMQAELKQSEVEITRSSSMFQQEQNT